MATRGFSPQYVLADKIGQVPFTVALLRHKQRDWQKLHVYAQYKDRVYLIYTHPGGISERLELDPIMLAEQFPDLLRDGSRVVVYRATIAGLNKKTLYIVRLKGLRAQLLGSFPEGELKRMGADSRPVIAAKSLPLGRFFTAECEFFSTLAQNAFETRLYAVQAGSFHDVSESYPWFYDEDIARLEEWLSRMPKEKHPGDYLSGTVSLYFDYAAKRERRKGWTRLNELLAPQSHNIPHLNSCLEQVKSTLRRKLSIPQDW